MAACDPAILGVNVDLIAKMLKNLSKPTKTFVR
jgi:hypothetical protein